MLSNSKLTSKKAKEQLEQRTQERLQQIRLGLSFVA